MIEIYKSSVENVRELKSNRKKIKRLINQSIKEKKQDILSTLTKSYALLYSAFVETCFLKMIHTPHGFSEDIIQQIYDQKNLEEKWLKCLELALKEIDNNSGEFHNKTQILTRLIQRYIIEPSHLRNKIAHGQWRIALNSENKSVNRDLTNRINALDFVRIDLLFEVYEKLGQVMEDLIESPEKAHFRDFYSHLTELENLIKKTSSWTIESKTKILNRKFVNQTNTRT